MSILGTEHQVIFKFNHPLLGNRERNNKEENMKIAITFTDQNPDGGAVIGKETYIVPVDEKYIPVKVINELKASFCRAVEITIVKN